VGICQRWFDDARIFRAHWRNKRFLTGKQGSCALLLFGGVQCPVAHDGSDLGRRDGIDSTSVTELLPISMANDTFSMRFGVEGNGLGHLSTHEAPRVRECVGG